MDGRVTMLQKTVVIHVGPPKTGTTSIQRFCVDAREALMQKGILYAETGRIPEGGQIYVMRRGGRTRMSRSIAHNLLPWTLLDEAENLTADDCWAEFVVEIRKSPVRNVLISSEAFCRLQISQIRKIREYLEGVDVRIIAYLRDPFSRMLSDFSQRVRSGTYFKSFTEFVADEQTLIDNYDQFVSYWDEVFTESHVLVRRFERSGNCAGLVPDFATTLLANPQPLLKFCPQQRLNISADSNSIRRLRILNRMECALGRPQFSRRIFSGLRNLITRISVFTGHPERRGSGRDLYSEANRDRVSRLAAKSYSKLLLRAERSNMHVPIIHSTGFGLRH
jgi:hypothetical protein